MKHPKSQQWKSKRRESGCAGEKKSLIFIGSGSEDVLGGDEANGCHREVNAYDCKRPTVFAALLFGTRRAGSTKALHDLALYPGGRKQVPGGGRGNY
jgi:hypothetical protein